MQANKLLDSLGCVDAITKIVRHNSNKTFVMFDYQGLQVASGTGSTEDDAIANLKLQKEVIENMIDLIVEDPEGLGLFYNIDVLKKLITFDDCIIPRIIPTDEAGL